MVTATRLVPSCAHTRAVGGVRSFESNTKRSGERPFTDRVVNCGLSLIAVPDPTRIASASRRRRCAHARAVAELIHFESPLAEAIRPSSETAAFTVMRGRLRSTSDANPAIRCSAWRWCGPWITSIPAARSASTPSPEPRLGSSAPTCTRATPARTISGAQGGGAALMVAGGEGHEQRRSARAVARLFERDDLGVVLARGLVTPFADDLAVAHEHRSHRRVGSRRAHASAGQHQRPAHRPLHADQVASSPRRHPAPRGNKKPRGMFASGQDARRTGRTSPPRTSRTFSHPDCTVGSRIPRDHARALARLRSRAITAGGDLHPAPKVRICWVRA